MAQNLIVLAQGVIIPTEKKPELRQGCGIMKVAEEAHERKRGRAAVVALLVILAATAYSEDVVEYDHEKYIVLGTTKYNFVGCSRGVEVPRILYDSQGRLITKQASAGALALRECLFVEEGDLVYLVRPGEIVQIAETAVAGYYISIVGQAQTFGPIWYPFRFIDVFRVELREPAVVDYETAAVPDLTGPLPVGRWSVWLDFNPERIAKSNSGWFGYHESEWELRADGRGNFLELHDDDERPEHGFSFPSASDFVWTHGDEFAWEWREPEAEYTGHLIFLTQRADVYVLERATDDLLVLLPSYEKTTVTWHSQAQSRNVNVIGSTPGH